jgi:hypothetical protein
MDNIMNFDLDINNFNNEELREMFSLPSNYDTVNLDNTILQFKNSINNNQSIDQSMKNQIINFIMEAQKVLSSDVTENLLKKVQEANIYHTDISLKPSQTTDAGNNFIIDKKVTPYAQSLPDLYYSGTLNPLKKRIITQNLNIDTCFRPNYYTSLSTDFHFDLPNIFSNVVDMQLSSFELPTSFYTISASLGNNFFVLRTEDSSGNDTSVFEVITIPDGDYTNADLISYLNNYVTTELNTTPFSTVVFIQNNTNNSGSGQMVIQTSNGTNFTLDFQSNIQGFIDLGTPLQLKFGWLIGYRAGKYIHNSTYISEGLINLLGLSYLYLVVDDYNNNVNNGFYNALTNSILNNNILARISIIKENPTKNFDIVNQNNLSVITSPRQYFGPVNIQKLHIQLLDSYGRVINLNNMDYSFCLTFRTVYDL